MGGGAGTLPDCSTVKAQRCEPTAHFAQITNCCQERKKKQKKLCAQWVTANHVASVAVSPLKERNHAGDSRSLEAPTGEFQLWVSRGAVTTLAHHAWVHFLLTLPSRTPILCLQRPLLRDATLIHRLSWELYIHTSRLLMRPPRRSRRQSWICFLFVCFWVSFQFTTCGVSGHKCSFQSQI